MLNLLEDREGLACWQDGLSELGVENGSGRTIEGNDGDDQLGPGCQHMGSMGCDSQDAAGKAQEE